MTAARATAVKNDSPSDAARPVGLAIPTIEAALLGLFMVSACGFGALLEHPDSPARSAIASPLARRTLMGLAMGLTAVGLVYSPWGKRSGPHLNPAVTICFLRLGHVAWRDAFRFIIAQFIGGAAGVLVMHLLMGRFLRDANVNYVATVPGSSRLIAWCAEALMTFILMSVVLGANRYPKLLPYTGYLTAALVAIYITVEAPLSGMSLNPARTFGSAIFARTFDGIWIYFTAPPLGMLAAVELRRRLTRDPSRVCGKLVHSHSVQCVFKCNCLEGASIETGNHSSIKKDVIHEQR